MIMEESSAYFSLAMPLGLWLVFLLYSFYIVLSYPIVAWCVEDDRMHFDPRTM